MNSSLVFLNSIRDPGVQIFSFDGLLKKQKLSKGPEGLN